MLSDLADPRVDTWLIVPEAVKITSTRTDGLTINALSKLILFSYFKLLNYGNSLLLYSTKKFNRKQPKMINIDFLLKYLNL